IYRDGVPNTDRTGRVRFDYEPGHSFFPIALYHALQGEFGGRRYELHSLAEAGFNTVLPWGGQEPGTVLDPAAASGLQVIWPEPTDAQLARFGDHPAILGWDIDHEPSVDPPDERAAARLKRFIARRAQIQNASPRPVFTINSPSIDGPRAALWRSWGQ